MYTNNAYLNNRILDIKDKSKNVQFLMAFRTE